MSTPAYLTLEDVVAHYRGQVSEGTLRNWRAMRIAIHDHIIVGRDGHASFKGLGLI
ncbi:hypothetical protein [Bosea sp. LjRoot237]|uniref:hypothetical protein n=1 Tax=Bosea sp. LjRoot237 TaxID=3342292 RepID=UPI003ECFC37D